MQITRELQMYNYLIVISYKEWEGFILIEPVNAKFEIK